MDWLCKLLCCVLLIYSSEGYLYSAIPVHLRDCYRYGGITLSAPRRLDVFLALLRKLETSAPVTLNLRLFSSSLLRNLRLDGIERYTTVETDIILPYRASSFQFHRYKLLMDLFLPTQSLLNAEEILSAKEKCLLHRMLSSTVREWERGDEKTTCIKPSPQTLERIPYITVDQSQSSSRVHSACPIEEGVIQTEWGTIAAGTLIAALACALEQQRVQVSDILTTDMFEEGVPAPFMASAKKEWMITLDDIGNVMVATLVGDLAEVVIHQGSKVGPYPQKFVIGTVQSWNDTLIPREHYLYAKNSSLQNEVLWHFTDAEILAGIDGLILADQIKLWANRMKTLRLSQVIEMYYSDGGISFDPDVKACNRKNLFSKIFDRQRLFTETVSFAHLMSLHQLNHYIPVTDIQLLAEAAVAAFSIYLNEVIDRNHRVCEESVADPVLDLIVATDSSWDGHTTQQFMSWLAQAINLNNDKTTLSLLHGTSGEWIVPPVMNVTELFNHLDNYDRESWPHRMSIPAVLSTVIEHSLNKTLNDIATNVSAGPRSMILLISPVDHPSTTEIETGKSLLNSLRTYYFDVFLAYLTQDLTDVDLKSGNNNELYISTLSSSLQDIITALDSELFRSNVPQKIVGTHCPIENDSDFSQEMYKDSVALFHTKYFRIHPFYLRKSSVIHVHFINNIDGRLKICTWRVNEGARHCEHLIEGEKFGFKFTNPCLLNSKIDDLGCPPIDFLVATKSLSNPCAEDECRLPNQVRFSIQHSGLNCLQLQASSAPVILKYSVFFNLLLSLIHIFCS